MPTCFIILPITTPAGANSVYPPDHFYKVLKEICVPAVTKNALEPIEPFRKGTYLIEQKILAQLHESNLLLCDISGLNPNVLFELGIRRALNKPFAIVRDEHTKVPFDLKNFHCFKYDSTAVHANKRDKERLITDLADHLHATLAEQKKMPTEPLIGAVASGITRIFTSREAAMKDIHEAMERASSRLWLMGVALSEEFRLSDYLGAIEDKIQSTHGRRTKFDAKILMLDALTSTGVFRSLLESKSESVNRIVNASRQPGDERLEEPYFNERLYQDFENTWKRFKGRDVLDNLVRFYGHAPAGWLVIADDIAYFEPYTFGSDPDSKKSAGDPIGPLMPVFKFESAENDRPFRILEKHFLRLWLTTDTDLFHVQARQPEASDTISKIFQNRGYWLKQVHPILHKSTGDRRRYPRKVCKSNLENYIRRSTVSGASQAPTKVYKVLNFSREGLAFKLLKATLHERNLELKENNRITVETVIPTLPKGSKRKEKAGEFVKKMLVDPYDGKFRVVHAREDGEFVIVGLKPIKKKSE